MQCPFGLMKDGGGGRMLLLNLNEEQWDCICCETQCHDKGN